MAKFLLRNFVKANIHSSVKAASAKVLRNKPLPKCPNSISRIRLGNNKKNTGKKKKGVDSKVMPIMPKSKNGYYAVRVGYKPGVYDTWYLIHICTRHSRTDFFFLLR